jgi:hypothetical protein
VGVLIEGLRCRCVKSISSIVSFQRKAKKTEKQSRWFIVKPREFFPNADNLKEILRCRMDRQVFAIRNDELLICWAKARVEKVSHIAKIIGEGRGRYRSHFSYRY